MSDKKRLSRLPVRNSIVKSGISSNMRSYTPQPSSSRPSDNKYNPNIGRSRMRSQSTSLYRQSSSSIDRLTTPQSQCALSVRARSISNKITPQSASNVRLDPRDEASEYNKIKNFVAEFNPNLKLKPISIVSFVDVINILLKSLGHNGSITSQNYKEKLPLILKSLFYPVTVPATLLKSLSSPNAFHKILAIWSYLLQMVEMQKDDVVEVCTDLLGMMKIDYYLQRGGNVFINCSSETDEEKYEHELGQMFGYDAEECENLRKQLNEKLPYNDKLINQSTALKEQVMQIEEPLLRKQTKLKEIEETNKTESEKYEEIHSHVTEIYENLESEIAVQNKNIQEINQRILEFGHNQAEVQVMIKDIDQLTHIITLSKERKEHLMAQINDIDFEYADKIKERLARIFKINNDINDFSSLIFSAKELLLPETRISGAAFMEEITLRIAQTKNYLEEMKNMKENLKSKNEIFISKIKTLESQLKQLEGEEIKFAASFETIRNAESHLDNERKKIYLLIEQLANDEAELQKLKEETINVDYYRNVQIMALDRVKDLEDIKLKEIKKIKQFLSSVHLVVARYMADTKRVFIKGIQSQEEFKTKIVENSAIIKEDLLKFKAELQIKKAALFK